MVSGRQPDINAKMNPLRGALTSVCLPDDIMALFSSLFSGFSLVFSPVSPKEDAFVQTSEILR